MKRSKFSDEQILAIVKGEAGRKVADLCRVNGITEQTYYRWKAKYGGMELSEMQRLTFVAPTDAVDCNVCRDTIPRRTRYRHRRVEDRRRK
jgi:putative transposase